MSLIPFASFIVQCLVVPPSNLQYLKFEFIGGPFIKALFGEGLIRWPTRPHDARGIGADEFADGLAVGSGRLCFGAVDHLPAFADDLALGQFSAELGGEACAAADAFLIDWIEDEILHDILCCECVRNDRKCEERKRLR